MRSSIKVEAIDALLHVVRTQVDDDSNALTWESPLSEFHAHLGHLFQTTFQPRSILLSVLDPLPREMTLVQVFNHLVDASGILQLQDAVRTD